MVGMNTGDTVICAASRFQPIPLGRARAPFSCLGWLFELEWNGFRALTCIDQVDAA